MIEYDVVEVDIDLLEVSPWNPNTMVDVKFNALADSIQDVGFVDPIQVVPMPNGKYRIIGGEHRFFAAQFAGMKEIPCFILKDDKFKDEDLQKFLCVRMNLIKGEMTPAKFSKLYEDVAKRYDEKFIAEAMGFVDRGEWETVIKDLLGRAKEMGRDVSEFGSFDDVTKELKTLDDITKLLEEIFRKKKKGEGLDYVLSVGAGGGKVIYFKVSSAIWGKLQEIKSVAVKKSMKVEDILKSGLK
jgi:hypothetical protein